MSNGEKVKQGQRYVSLLLSNLRHRFLFLIVVTRHENTHGSPITSEQRYYRTASACLSAELSTLRRSTVVSTTRDTVESTTCTTNVIAKR
jgi:hypothetical protein